MKFKHKFVKKPMLDYMVAVPYDTENDEFQGLIKLNETASFIWDQIEDEKNSQEILELMIEKFDIDKETAKQDLDNVLNQMKTSGIIED